MEFFCRVFFYSLCTVWNCDNRGYCVLLAAVTASVGENTHAIIEGVTRLNNSAGDA